MSALLDIALREYGVEEIVGGMHNPTVLQYFREAGHNWVHDDETAWCSAFMNAMAIRAGLEYTGKLNARSWLYIGKEINDPVPGIDIVILWRGSLESWKGHVGIYINHDEDGRHINVLGGNQGNKVCISGYDKGRLLGYRRLGLIS